MVSGTTVNSMALARANLVIPFGAPQPFYVEAGPAANPGGLPVGGRPVIDIPNNHVQYAITWYGLAAGLLAVYVFYRRAERRRPADP